MIIDLASPTQFEQQVLKHNMIMQKNNVVMDLFLNKKICFDYNKNKHFIYINCLQTVKKRQNIDYLFFLNNVKKSLELRKSLKKKETFEEYFKNISIEYVQFIHEHFFPEDDLMHLFDPEEAYLPHYYKEFRDEIYVRLDDFYHQNNRDMKRVKKKDIYLFDRNYRCDKDFCLFINPLITLFFQTVQYFFDFSDHDRSLSDLRIIIPFYQESEKIMHKEKIYSKINYQIPLIQRYIQEYRYNKYLEKQKTNRVN